MSGSSRTPCNLFLERVDDGDFGAVIDAAIERDARAVEGLVREFRSPLVSHARRHDTVDPEGLADVTLWTALAKLETFNGRSRTAFRAYLFRILRRRVIDEVRYNSVRPRSVLDGADLLAEVIDDRASSFDDRVIERAYVGDLLTELTAEQRQIVQLRMLDDLSIQETADRTGRSVTAVKAMQRRAISALRSAIGRRRDPHSPPVVSQPGPHAT